MPRLFRFQSQTTMASNASGFGPADRSQTVRPRVIASRLRRLAAALSAKLEQMRDRREIAAMGPFARRELHDLLMARGEGGIPDTLWRAHEWAADAERLWPRPSDQPGVAAADHHDRRSTVQLRRVMATSL